MKRLKTGVTIFYMEKYLEFIDPHDQSSGNIFIRAEHLARYLFAAEYTGRRRLKRVLDAACGNGYGSRILARRAESVEGVDRNSGLVEQGGLRIAEEATEGIRLHAADLNAGLSLFKEEKFDCIVCFETLEHVERDMELLGEFRRVLRRDGALLLSVPKEGYEPADAGGRPENPYHLRLYGAEGLAAQLEGCGFRVERILGQPYSNIARVRMEDYRRDAGASYDQIAGYFVETAESLEFYAKVWGWPVEEYPEKSNTLIAICKRL